MFRAVLAFLRRAPRTALILRHLRQQLHRERVLLCLALPLGFGPLPHALGRTAFPLQPLGLYAAMTRLLATAAGRNAHEMLTYVSRAARCRSSSA